MQTFTVLLAAASAVALASAADAAPRRKPAPVDPGVQAQEQSNRFIRDAFQPWATGQQPAAPRTAKKSRVKKKG